MLRGGKYNGKCIIDERGIGWIYVGVGYSFKYYGRKEFF